jgi:hypothetical protein
MKVVALILILSASALAQGRYQFLGPPHFVADRESPIFHIKYNTRGYDNFPPIPQKKINKFHKKGIPNSIIDEIVHFPGSQIGQWIDEKYQKVRDQFIACGGIIGSRAAKIQPKVFVQVQDTAFYEPYNKVDVLGVYYPAPRLIMASVMYYHWKGPNKGWYRPFPVILEWEMGNYFAVSTGVTPEPRPAGWPCID